MDLSLFKIKVSYLPFLFFASIAAFFLSSILSSDYFTVFLQRISEVAEQSSSFIRFQQLFLGLKLSFESFVFGQSSSTILSELSAINTSVFENAYVDLAAKYGLIVLFLLFYVLYSLNHTVSLSPHKYLLKVTLAMLACSFFNEILLEVPFWSVIYYAFLLDNKAISRQSS